jgi:hypothetical protein
VIIGENSRQVAYRSQRLAACDRGLEPETEAAQLFNGSGSSTADALQRLRLFNG